MFKINEYKLKTNFSKKIVHISDIHYANHFKKSILDKLLKTIIALKPDYVCITGDIVDKVEFRSFPDLNAFLTRLALNSKVIISLGNHDLDVNNKRFIFDNLKNVVILDNNYYEDKDIYVYGLTLPKAYYEKELKNRKILLKTLNLVSLKKDKYNILLLHSPINLDKVACNFDLVLSGHTHNGLTPHFIPGNFGIVGPNYRLFLPHMRGSFKLKKGLVIISGGITKLSYGTGMLHLFNSLYKADINVIFLTRNG